MFGYIVPYMPELKGSDHELYQAYYCGLCRSLGKYGLGSKMTLTYDATFALALLTAVTGEKTELEPRGCAAHPVRGRIPTARPNAVSDYCAAVCVLLARYKLMDDARDGRPVRRAALPVIHRGVKAAERKYPEAAETLSSGLAVLVTCCVTFAPGIAKMQPVMFSLNTWQFAPGAKLFTMLIFSRA